MKKSRKIQLVLISSFLASCVTQNPDDWSRQYTENFPYDPPPNLVPLPHAAVRDTISHYHVVGYNDYWRWHGSFRPYTYYYRFCEPTPSPSRYVSRPPGNYLRGGGAQLAKPGVARGGFGHAQTAIS